MKKFFIALLVVFVLVPALLLVALWRVPASVVPMMLEEAEARQLLPPDAPRIKLDDTQGTVWQGQANKSQLTIDGIQLDLGKVSWQLDMASLLDRQLVLHLTADAEDHQLKGTVVAANPTQVSLYKVEGRMPISKLEPWMPMLVKGDIAFVVDHLEITQQRLTAIDGVLNLEYVDWIGGDRDMPLGSYMAQIYLQQERVQVQLNDFAATLGLNGLLSIAPSGNYTFKATLKPRPGLAPEVAETIGWLGRRAASGEVSINKSGRF